MGMISGCTVNLSNLMASFNRSDNLFDDGNINAMFSGVFSAGSFDGLGFDFGKSDNMRSSIAVMSPVLRISFSLGFSLGRALDNDRAASFADHIFAPLFVCNFFTFNFGFGTFLGNSRCARLDFQCVCTMFAGWMNMSHNSMMVEVRVSLGPGQSHGCQHRNQSNLSNHDFFPRIEFELK